MAYARSIAVIACLAAFVTLISRATADGEICDGEFKEPVRSLKEVENLSTEGCPEFFVKAHRNLIKLLDKDEPVCTMDKANKITNYYDEYLSLEAEQANGGAKLPRDFIKFVVAYGMLVGNKCKQFLLDDGFFHKATAHLDATDFEVMQPWTRDNGMIDHVLRFFPYALYAFPLPSYLTPIHPGFANDLKLALEKQASGGSTESLALVSETCKKRFRPVYEKVALPIAHLDRHGFIQQFSGDQLFHTGAVHQTSLWQRIVFLCELLIDQDQEPSSASNLINRPKVQFEPTKVHLDVYIANPPPSWLDRTITKEQRLAGLLGEKFLLLNSEYSDKETDQVMRKVLESVKKIIDEKNAQLQVLLDRKKEKEAAAAAEAAAHSLRGKLKKCFRGSKTAE